MLRMKHIAASHFVLLYQPITTRCYFSIPLENIRKLGFLMFSEGIENTTRLKWVKYETFEVCKKT